ncbi:MAG: hypothetical protein ACYC9S_11305 [Leptospirales bacterium]
MRTTLTIDDDLLAAAKEIAARQHKSIGEVISHLTRQTLQPSSLSGHSRNGILHLSLQSDSIRMTARLINPLGDDLPGCFFCSISTS